jgi:lipopolysaccharide transport system permease protein
MQKDAMFADLTEAAQRWRLVHLLGVATLRARYARSRFGQTWLTLSNMVFVVVVGLVWANIWKQEIDRFLPYFGAGYILFQFLAQTVGESPGSLVGDSRLYRNERLPFFVSALANVYRHFLMLIHNVPVLVALILWSASATLGIGFAWLYCLLLSVTFLVFAGYALSLVCARFRDIGQLVAIAMQVLFLLTPVMWQVEQLPPEYRPYVFSLNPFAAMLEGIRNPVVGLPVPPEVFQSLPAWVASSIALAWLAHARLGRTAIFWI